MRVTETQADDVGARPADNSEVVLLVDRQEELQQVEAALERTREGGFGLLQIVGQPGIGKTRMLQETLALARGAGYIALTGRAVELESDAPFSIFVDAFDDFLGSPEAKLDVLRSEELAELAAVFPAVGAFGPGRTDGLQTERHKTFNAVRSMLTSLSRERPIVVALDDVHWADEASTELLTHLLQRPPVAPILLVVTLRKGHVDRQLEGALVEAQRRGCGVRLGLDPLALVEATQLLDGAVDRRSLAAMYEESGGNPFYLLQLARGSEQDLSALGTRTRGADESGVPYAVRGAIDSELERLDETSRVFLQAASVLGDPFDAEIACEVAGLEPDRWFTEVDTLQALDLVQPGEDPHRFSFRHPIVRRSVYESARGGWRLSAHKRAAEALTRRGAPASARAFHVEQIASIGDYEAIAVLIEAADASALRAPAMAARWLQAALALMPESEDNRSERATLLAKVGMALASSGQIVKSREVLRRMLEQAPAGMPEKTQAVIAHATVETALGHIQDAKRGLVRMLDEAAETDSETGMIRVTLASTSLVECDFPEAARWADEAVASLPADDPGRSTALGIRATVACATDDDRDPVECVDLAAELLDGHSDELIASRPAALFWLGWSEALIGRFGASVAHAERGIRIARSRGLEMWYPQLACQHAIALSCKGQIDAAADVVDAAVEAASLSSNRLGLAPGLALKCSLEAARGRGTAAIGLGERAVSVAEQANSVFLVRFAKSHLADAWLELGFPARARELLCPNDPDVAEFLPVFETRWYELLTRTAVQLDDIAAAERWAGDAERVARRLSHLDVPSADAARARATVLQRTGDHEQAGDLALAAVQLYEQAGMPVEAARGRLVVAEALVSNDERGQAIAQLTLAEQALATLGAMHYRDEVARQLRRLGQRAPSRSLDSRGSGIGALSGREVQVAELVTAGLKNREIAAELFISHKTVEVHISKIFRKLGVSSRVEVASTIERTRRQVIDLGESLDQRA